MERYPTGDGMVNTMPIADKITTMTMIRHHQIHAKQSFGQNFLIQEAAALAVAQHPLITPDTVVIEIGPGLGALTEPLTARAYYTYAIEIDPVMVAILHQTFAATQRLEIVTADITKIDWRELASRHPNHPVVVVSNLPYYLTSEILLDVLAAPLPVVGCLAMMQKEVARRLLTSEGGKDENELTLCSKFYATLEKVKEVSKNDFIPRPTVDSTIVAFTLNTTRYEPRLHQQFGPMVRQIFRARRKTLTNNLEPLFSNKAETVQWLMHHGFHPQIRPEALPFVEVVRLIEQLTKEGFPRAST